jgi:hypothetical protein
MSTRCERIAPPWDGERRMWSERSDQRTGTIVGFSDTARAASAGAFAPNTAWVDGVGYKPWQGHSRAAQLAGSAIRYNAMHLGEAVTIRSLAGFALGI